MTTNLFFLPFQTFDHPRHQVRVSPVRQSVHEPKISGHPQARKTRIGQGVEHAAPASAAATTSGTAGNDSDGAASPHATTATAGHVEQTNGSSRSVQHDCQAGISSSINFFVT